MSTRDGSQVDSDKEEGGEYAWEKKHEWSWNKGDDADKAGETLRNLLIRKRREQRIDYSIKRLLFRNLVIVIDLSVSMLETDFKPSRLEMVSKYLKNFIDEFKQQNPLSSIGLVVSKGKKAMVLSQLTQNERKITELLGTLSCEGGYSLQNALEFALNLLSMSPSRYKKEVLCVLSSLTTFDPSDVLNTAKKLLRDNVRCSIISLSGEVFLYSKIAQETNGEFSVPLDANHFWQILLSIIPPPPDVTSPADTQRLERQKETSDIIQVGFPGMNSSSDIQHICSCHLKVTSQYYICPQCGAVVCDIPCSCPICLLLLMDYSDLTRSFHHLVPPLNYKVFEPPVVSDSDSISSKSISPRVTGKEATSSHTSKPSEVVKCFGCRSVLFPTVVASKAIPSVKSTASKAAPPSSVYQCPKCSELFCEDCEQFVHDRLYNCPGCCYISH